ncbi:MAG: outer membrane beta-barrel protein [Gammaproteobacteria bacterium]
MRRVIITLLVGLIAFYGSPAMAVDLADGFYWGGSGGVAEEPDTCKDIPTPQGLTEITGCDDSDFGWQLFVGYQFMKWLSVEGGYAELGGSEAIHIAAVDTSDTTGWTLNAVVTLPYLEKLGLYGTGGAFFWDREITGGGGAQTRFETSDTGTDFFYGIGLRYPLTRNIGINLEAKAFNDVGSGKVGTSDLRLYSAGLLVRY